MVTKTPQEIDEMRLLIQEGKLPPDAIKQHFIDEEKLVFGHDFRKVKGQPVEKGIGAPGHETQNHLNAIRKYEGEAAYNEALAKVKKKA